MNHVYLFVIVNNVIHIVMKSGKCLLMLLMILFSPMAFAQQSGVNVTGSNGTIAERKRQCHGTRCGERP